MDGLKGGYTPQCKGSSHGVVANVLAYSIVVSKFKLQSLYHVDFVLICGDIQTWMF